MDTDLLRKVFPFNGTHSAHSLLHHVCVCELVYLKYIDKGGGAQKKKGAL